MLGVASLDELVRPERVHRSLYTDRDVFAQEMERVFGGTWTYLAHESEIPQPNDFVRRRLGLRPVLVTRDKQGQVHGLLNRCTHRGATVCRVDTGNAARFVCPYHNWTFANNGRLVGVPLRRGYGPGFDPSTLDLGRLRVESYRGFVFGALDASLPPLEEHLGHAARLIDQWLDRWSGAEIVVRHGSHRLTYRGNWKLALDNSADGYHPGFSHASLLRMRKERYGGGVDMQWTLGDVDAGLQTVTDLGNGNTFLDQRAEIDSYWAQSAPMPGEQSYERLLRERLGDEAAAAALEVAVGSGMNLNIFPNLLIIGNQIQVVEPHDVDDTHLVWYATSLEAPDLPPEITALRMRLQEDFPSFGEPDDLANFEECHAGLLIPEMEWVVTDRHLETGRETRDEHGHLTGPVSDELPIRAFWARWKDLMSSTTKLAAL
jgi:phenylpropionate dioxygenase-like ring-hydroxylating dioxygenase large terminal subunit